MAARNLGKHWVSIPTEYLNRNISQSAQEAFDAVSASSSPCHNVSWLDLYAIFRNSRQLMEDADGLGPSGDRKVQVLIDIMREDHIHLRRLLFLVAIEKLFNLGSQNAMAVLWTYGEQLECVEQISERLTETEEEITQLQAPWKGASSTHDQSRQTQTRAHFRPIPTPLHPAGVGGHVGVSTQTPSAACSSMSPACSRKASKPAEMENGPMLASASPLQ
jgi:hypothetical protein